MDEENIGAGGPEELLPLNGLNLLEMSEQEKWKKLRFIFVVLIGR